MTIRDPSDGSVREPHGESPSSRSEKSVREAEGAIASGPLLEQIGAALLAGKVKPEKLSEQWAYQRAWNDGIDFSLKQINRIFSDQGT